jgi:hypothetical protein
MVHPTAYRLLVLLFGVWIGVNVVIFVFYVRLDGFMIAQCSDGTVRIRPFWVCCDNCDTLSLMLPVYVAFSTYTRSQ